MHEKRLVGGRKARHTNTYKHIPSGWGRAWMLSIGSRQVNNNPLGNSCATPDDQSHIARPSTQQARELLDRLLDCKTVQANNNPPWQQVRDTGRPVSHCTPTNAASQQAISLPARLQHCTHSLTVSRQANNNPLGSERATLDDQSHSARPPTQQASKLSACLLDCNTVHSVSQ